MRTIKVSKESLEAFALFDMRWYDITLLPLSVANEVNIVCDSFIEFSLDDMAEVLEKVIERDTKSADFFLTWFEPLIIHFYDNLSLNELFGNSPGAIANYRQTYMPQTDDELLKWIISYLFNLYQDMEAIMLATYAKDYICAQDLLDMIDIQQGEVMFPVERRHYIDQIKQDYIHELDNDLILREADKGTKLLFKKYVNELADKGDIDALRIKGYALSGGNSVFKCDWKEAANCLEILWRDGGIGYAANSLGYIYFDGRLSDGRPDYENAFKYFSIGHSFGVFESTLKLSEMYLKGLYVARNINIAGNLIENVYNDKRKEFEEGNFDGNFAEAALRMGEIQLATTSLSPEFEKFTRIHAYGFFLQAEFAIVLRQQFAPIQTDKQLLESTIKKTEELSSDYKVYKRSYHSSFPGPLQDFVRARNHDKFKLGLKPYKNGKVKIEATRLPSRGSSRAALTLLTYREFCTCTLTDTLSVTAENACYRLTKNDIFFDDITIENLSDKRVRINFLLEDSQIAYVEADSFLISKPNK